LTVNLSSVAHIPHIFLHTFSFPPSVTRTKSLWLWEILGPHCGLDPLVTYRPPLWAVTLSVAESVSYMDSLIIAKAGRCQKDRIDCNWWHRNSISSSLNWFGWKMWLMTWFLCLPPIILGMHCISNIFEVFSAKCSNNVWYWCHPLTCIMAWPTTLLLLLC